MSGTLPIALTQQLDVNGTPLAGALLYFYQVGTVAAPQDSFSDYALTNANPNPLSTDQYGRIPMFYLADGQVHVRLTDAYGTVIFDYPSMQVIGPSSGGGGGGGGGGTVDPTAIASSGDFKWRATSETLTGWVKANGQTIGNATSGATQRANADTLSLYTHLWQNYPDAKCPVVGGRGSSATSDFSANKAITLPDLRGRSPFGLDNMGNSLAGRIQQSNITSGGGDGAGTASASGGEANHVLTTGEMPAHSHGVNFNDPGHSHTPDIAGQFAISGSGFSVGTPPGSGINPRSATGTSTTGITVSLNNTGGGSSHNTMPPFLLGTWWIKL